MKDTDYTKQLYLYDDRNKYDYMLKVTDILFQDDTVILCRAVMIGSSEYEGQVEEEKLLINKTDSYVKNSEYDSWIATSNEVWVDEKIKSMLEREQQ